jgi:HSP20 family protein
MAIVRWNPAGDFVRMREGLDRLVRGLFSDELPEASLVRGEWAPAVDIRETGDNLIITAELPGMGKDDVKVNYEDGVLTIRGEKKQEHEHKDANYHRVERSYGVFERSFRLPSRVAVEKIEAKFKDGVLHLTLPKAEEARPKQIQINVG